MILNSADNASEFAELDPESGQLTYFCRESPSYRDNLDLSGLFAVIENVVVLFYRNTDHLMLKLGNKEFPIDELTTSRLKRSLRYQFVQQVPGNSLRRTLSRLLYARSRFELIRDGDKAFSSLTTGYLHV
ncbi:MAG TPA: hypothetical protein VLB68_17610 [Pyrinomonadaceae bacterium]|nr:hypothetical protein [Pyrinomonadaceae bacterium]